MLAAKDALVSQHEAWAATHHIDAAGDPVAEADRGLLDRARLGLRVIMAGVAAVFIGWIVLHPGERPLLSIVQALNFAAAAVALRLMRDPSRRALEQGHDRLRYPEPGDEPADVLAADVDVRARIDDALRDRGNPLPVGESGDGHAAGVQGARDHRPYRGG